MGSNLWVCVVLLQFISSIICVIRFDIKPFENTLRKLWNHGCAQLISYIVLTIFALSSDIVFFEVNLNHECVGLIEWIGIACAFHLLLSILTIRCNAMFILQSKHVQLNDMHYFVVLLCLISWLIIALFLFAEMMSNQSVNKGCIYMAMIWNFVNLFWSIITLS